MICMRKERNDVDIIIDYNIVMKLNLCLLYRTYCVLVEINNFADVCGGI